MRATHLLPGIASAATAGYAIEGGFRLEFEPNGEVLAAIVRMIDAERQCCQFLGFSSPSKRRLDQLCSR